MPLPTEDPIIEMTRAVTLIERPGNNFDIQVDEAMYENEEKLQNLHNFMLQTDEVLANEVAKHPKDEKVVQNGGSLYDNVVFESTMYIGQNSEVLINTTFGHRVNPDTNFGYAMLHVTQAWQWLADNLDKLPYQ